MKSLSPLLEAISSFEEVEKQVSDRPGSYQGLVEEALLTSVNDYQLIFEALPGISTWIELGSGHGRGPVLFSYLYPEKRSIGVEFDEARFRESERLKSSLKLDNVSFIHADLISAEIPVGDVYFLYFPTGPVLDRILAVLGRREGTFQIVAIESHGDLLPRLNLEKWLEVHKEIPIQSKRHHNKAVVYKNVALKEASLLDLSFQHQFLLIRDASQEVWIGETYGLQWQVDGSYLLALPPRSIKESQIIGLLNDSELSDELRTLIHIRRYTRPGLRKIFLNPLRGELSDGRILDFNDIVKFNSGNT